MDEEERLQELVDLWQEEDKFASQLFANIHELEGAIRRKDPIGRISAIRKSITEKASQLANAARYSGQAFGLSSGEEPPEP